MDRRRADLSSIWGTRDLVFRFETPTYSWAGEDLKINWAFSDLHTGTVGCQPGVNCFATATPEPATLLLTATGLTALIAARKRRRDGGNTSSYLPRG